MKWSVSRIYIVFSLLWLASAKSQAQATWNGLQFGMTVDAVRSQLASHSVALVATEDKPDHFIVAPVYTLQTEGIISSVDFVVEADFDKSRLSHIRLRLDRAKLVNGQIADGLMLVAQLPQEIQNLLNSKYGRPVDSRGECDNSIEKLMSAGVPSILTCDTTWRDTTQQVTAYWSYSTILKHIEVPVPGKNKTRQSTKLEQIFGYQIDYRPQTSGL